MGGAMLRNLIKNGFNASKIKVIDPFVGSRIPVVEYIASAANLPSNYHPDIVFVALKPQDSKDILVEFFKEKRFSKNTVFVSIVAGKKINFYTSIFGKKIKIVRSMPNLAVIENQGVVAYLSKNLSDFEIHDIKYIFSLFGEVVELKNEKDFDSFTAIFGSGPAYIFYLQEIFLKITSTLNIDEKISSNLVKKLFLGSSILSNNSNLSFSDLRDSVTSKNGTTESALSILRKKNNLEKIFYKAIKMASKRSKELSK